AAEQHAPFHSIASRRSQQTALHIKLHKGRGFCAKYRLFVQAISDRRSAASHYDRSDNRRLSPTLRNPQLGPDVKTASRIEPTAASRGKRPCPWRGSDRLGRG